jgi:hypothetical protein
LCGSGAGTGSVLGVKTTAWCAANAMPSIFSNPIFQKNGAPDQIGTTSNYLMSRDSHIKGIPTIDMRKNGFSIFPKKCGSSGHVSPDICQFSASRWVILTGRIFQASEKFDFRFFQKSVDRPDLSPPRVQWIWISSVAPWLRENSIAKNSRQTPKHESKTRGEKLVKNSWIFEQAEFEAFPISRIFHEFFTRFFTSCPMVFHEIFHFPAPVFRKKLAEKNHVHPGETIGARKNRVNFKIDFFGKKKWNLNFPEATQWSMTCHQIQGGHSWPGKMGWILKLFFSKKKIKSEF